MKDTDESKVTADYKRNHNTRRRNKEKRSGKGKDYMHSSSIDAPQDKVDSNTNAVFNDLRWYVASEQILNDAARIPYNIPVGVPYRRNGKWNYAPENFTAQAYDNALPGIFVSCIMPTLGDTNDGPSAAVNIAANSLWQFVRSKISGTRPYIPVDMMLYMGAMDSLYCYVTWLTRLYATMFTYHQANRYLAEAIIDSQNVDYNDLRDNLTLFRTRINQAIAKVRALYLPSVLPIFLRHSWMFSHYFTEGMGSKDQIYFHTLAGVHRFVKDGGTGWGGLEAIKLFEDREFPLTVAQMLQILDSMINPIYQDEDFNRIAGDMLKAYEGRVFTLTEIPDIATVTFAFSEEVLLQFKNAKYKMIPGKSDEMFGWANGFFDYYQLNQGILRFRGSDNTAKAALYNRLYVGAAGNFVSEIGPNNPGLTSRMIMGAVMHEWSKDTLLTSPHADVLAGENMINTRLTLAMAIDANPSVDDGYDLPNVTFGSEWPVCYYLCSYHRNKSTGKTSLYKIPYDRILTITTADAAYVRDWCSSQAPIRSAFKYLPELSLIVYGTNPDDSVMVYESGRSMFEVDNYALINSSIIEGMHKAAILGEYNIPDLSIKP